MRKPALEYRMQAKRGKGATILVDLHYEGIRAAKSIGMPYRDYMTLPANQLWASAHQDYFSQSYVLAIYRIDERIQEISHDSYASDLE